MHVKAVDLNSKAIEIAKQNVILNELEDNVEVLQSDLFEAVKNESFDLIVSNPPFLPMLSASSEVYFFADGGSDGLRIIRRIVDEGEKYLTERGKIILIGGGFGDEKGPFFRRELNDITVQNKWHTSFVLISQTEAKTELERLENALNGLSDAIKNAKSELSEEVISSYYPFILIIDKQYPSDTVEINNCSQSLKDYMKELRLKKKN